MTENFDEYLRKNPMPTRLLDCVDCEGLSVDLDNSQPYLCMYDDHWSMKLEDLSKECFKELI